MPTWAQANQRRLVLTLARSRTALVSTGYPEGTPSRKAPVAGNTPSRKASAFQVRQCVSGVKTWKAGVPGGLHWQARRGGRGTGAQRQGEGRPRQA